MSDHVHEVDCDVDPRQPAQSIAHAHSDHGWTVASTGSEELSYQHGEDRLLRSHMLHYVDSSWDPCGNPGGPGGAWRHTFELDSLAVLLRDGVYFDTATGAPGSAEWFVPRGENVIGRSAVRVEGMSDDVAISERRGRNLLGFVNGRDFADSLWEGEDTAREFKQVIESGPQALPEPSMRDLGPVSAALEREDRLRDAHEAALTTGVSLAILLAPTPLATGAMAGVALSLLQSAEDGEVQHESDPVSFNGGFKASLEQDAPVQGHRVVFDVFTPRCTPTAFRIESSFGGPKRSARWTVNLPAVEGDSPCDGAGQTTAPDVRPADRFSARPSPPSSTDWGNYEEPVSTSVAIRPQGEGAYAIDASETLAPNDPDLAFDVEIWESTNDFDPDAPSTAPLGDPVHSVTGGDALQCVQIDEPGTYAVRVSPADHEGDAWRQFRVTGAEFEPLDPEVLGPSTVPAGEEATFTANPQYAVGSAEVKWLPPLEDRQSSFTTDLQERHTFSEPGTYEVSVAVRDESGEVAQASKTVTVEEPSASGPSVEIQGPSRVPAHEEVTFAARPDGLQSSPSFNWLPPVGDGNSSFDDGFSQDHTFTEPGTYEVEVAMSTTRGAGAGDTKTVTVEPAGPSVTLTADDTSVFVGDAVDFEASTSGFDGSPTLSWEGISASGASPSASWSEGGTHVVEVTAEAGDQVASDTVEVSVAAPDVEISGPETAGTNEELVFSAKPIDFRSSPSYNWLAPVGDSNSYFDDGFSERHTFTSEGTYEAEVHVSGEAGEVATATHEVVIDDDATVDLRLDDSWVEVGESVEIEAAASGFGGSPSFDWSGVDGSGSTVSASWDEGGTHVVEVTADDGDESDSDRLEVTVREPSVSIDGPRNVTAGDEVTYSASVEEFRGSTDYNWQPPVADGNSNFDDGPSTTHTFSDGGSYDVTVAVQSDAGESASKTITVDVEEPYESVSVTLSADDTSVQDGDQVTFDADADGGEGSIDYDWSGASGSGSTVTESWGSGGTYTVEVTASDGQTADTDDVEISVREPSVSIDGPRTVDEGERVSYSASVEDFLGSNDYNWGPPVADGNSNFDDGPSASHTFSSPGSYDVDVTVTSDQGETATATISVDVNSTSSGGGGGGSGGGGGGGNDNDDNDDDGGSSVDCTKHLPDDRSPTGPERRQYQNCKDSQ